MQETLETYRNTLSQLSLTREQITDGWSWPVFDFIEAVWHAAEWGREGEYGTYCTPEFHFARFIKGHPQLINLEADEAFRIVDSLFRLRLRLGESVEERWSEAFFGYSDADDSAAEFMAIWQKVKVPVGVDRLREAFRRARQRGPIPGLDGSEAYRLFLSAVRELRGLVEPDEVIFMPVHNVSAILGCSAMSISRFRDAAVASGYIRLLRPHDRAQGLSTEFEVTDKLLSA
jgi:hypothetical protein